MTTEFGRLLKAAMKANDISQRTAATEAGISESRWRQIASGRTRVSKQDIPTTMVPATVAVMADAVGIPLREAFAATGITDPEAIAEAESVVKRRRAEKARSLAEQAWENRRELLARYGPDDDRGEEALIEAQERKWQAREAAPAIRGTNQQNLLQRLRLIQREAAAVAEELSAMWATDVSDLSSNKPSTGNGEGDNGDGRGPEPAGAGGVQHPVLDQNAAGTASLRQAAAATGKMAKHKNDDQQQFPAVPETHVDEPAKPANGN